MDAMVIQLDARTQSQSASEQFGTWRRSMQDIDARDGIDCALTGETVRFPEGPSGHRQHHHSQGTFMTNSKGVGLLSFEAGGVTLATSSSSSQLPLSAQKSRKPWGTGKNGQNGCGCDTVTSRHGGTTSEAGSPSVFEASSGSCSRHTCAATSPINFPPFSTMHGSPKSPQPTTSIPSTNSVFALNPATAASTITFTRVAPDPDRIFVFPAVNEASPNASSGFGWREPVANSLKRARPSSDVDGPLTATLGCKKRRLRRQLVTSRLSRPFSVPATHILNREGVGLGVGLGTSGALGKRLFKLAAIAAARRMTASTAGAMASDAGYGGLQIMRSQQRLQQLQQQQSHQKQPPQHQQPHHHPSASELLRRAAIINRFRLRVYVQAAERGDVSVADMAASTALLQFSPGLQGVVAGTGSASAAPPTYHDGGVSSTAGMGTPPQQTSPATRALPPVSTTPLLQSPQQPSSASSPPSSESSQARHPQPTINQIPSAVRPLPPPQPSPFRPPPPPFSLPAAIMAAPHPLSRAAAAARGSLTPPGSPSKALRPADCDSSPSSRIRFPSISPRLPPLNSSAAGPRYDGDEEDSGNNDEDVAFPTSMLESRYEPNDEPDDVYADFSVIFGGGAGASDGEDEDSGGSDVERYEEFMDDLDGIPWSAR